MMTEKSRCCFDSHRLEGSRSLGVALCAFIAFAAPAFALVSQGGNCEAVRVASKVQVEEQHTS